MPFLVTGWSGTGKSTLSQELNSRGIEAIDTDRVKGLCGWVDKRTDINYGDFIPEPFAENNFYWNWDPALMVQLVQENPRSIFCGSSNNLFRFFPLFSKIVVLNLPETEQRRRMMTRAEHDFGKKIETQNIVIARQPILVKEAQKMGAIIIDASGPASEVADTVLEVFHENN